MRICKTNKVLGLCCFFYSIDTLFVSLSNEAGCSVIEAVEKAEIDRASYENYLKMQRENAYFESTVVERRKKDKDFGKMLKNYKKEMKQK